MRRSSTIALLLGTFAVPACSARYDLGEKSAALATAPAPAPEAGYRTLTPSEVGDQDEGRRQAIALGLITVPEARPLPAPGEALAVLQTALTQLSASLPPDSIDAQQMNQLISDVGQIAEGRLSLSLGVFCLSSAGIQKWLDGSRSGDLVLIDATHDALVDVCSQIQAYEKLDVPYSADPFVDWNLPPSIFVDGPDCAKLFISTPDVAPNSYDPRAYLRDPVSWSTLVLEEGQRFGAQPKCKETASRSYGMSFSLSWGANTAKLTDFSSGLLKTVPMPNGVVAPGQLGPTPAFLWAQTVRKDCDNSGCSYTNLGPPEGWPLSIAPVGSLCSVTSKFHDFSINDRKDADWLFQWQTNYALSISGSAVDWTSGFEAYAWTPVDITPPGYPWGKLEKSSAPIYHPIKEGDRYAVHSQDRFSVFDKVAPKVRAPQPREAYVGQVGALEQTGLLFPHVVGYNWNQGGLPFSYTCAPQPVQRDFVAFCTLASPNDEPPDFDPPTDSEYLYPFKGSVFVIQGNGGILSHHTPEQEFAYDFDTEVGSTDQFAYAARGGVVIDVHQEFDGHVPYFAWSDCMVDVPGGGMTTNPSCDNNLIVIRHIDGTTAHYLHIEHHGSKVKVGDIVQRGQLIAKSGNVGNSGVRHIHFDVHSGGQSIPSRFDGGAHSCSKAHYADWPDGTLGPSYPISYREWQYADYSLPLKR